MKAHPPIAELLPQSGHMVLLDEVIEASGSRIACRVRPRADTIFAAGGRVPALLAVEWMAQAVAAYAGLRSRAAGEPIRIGYLLGTRELTLETDHFDVGDELIVEAKHVFGDERLGSFKCVVTCAGRSLAAATISVYQGGDGEMAQ